MKVALLQNNTVIGDLIGNSQKIVKSVRNVEQDLPDLIVTHELSLLGYPPRDLLLMEQFIRKSWEVLDNLASILNGSPPVLVGIAEPNPSTVGRPLFNSAVLIHGGDIVQKFRKTLLPTYDVFDEERYFEPASGAQIFRHNGRAFGISICEDIWNDRDFWNRQRYHTDPISEAVKSGAECIINISASPFTVGKQSTRESMLSAIAKKYNIPVVYVNQAGANDELVFDGRSCAFNSNGKLIARCSAFEEDTITVDFDPSADPVVRKDDFTPESEIWRALVRGIRDYTHKNGFHKVVVGLSGGIDSSLVAAIAAESLGHENVLGVMMPSPYSSSGSIEDAEKLASNLSISTLVLPISDIMQVIEKALGDVFRSYQRDITEENIQARIRSILLMALANKFGSLLLTTGNKSEMAVGYCTLYGDMAGGLAVISDVPKTMVYRVARWLNARRNSPVIPEEILLKPPSAELRPDQKDQDALPPYELLDDVVERYVVRHQSPGEIIMSGIPADTVNQVVWMIKNSEFKRKQAAPGLKITDRAFGTGWRMPITRYDWYSIDS